MQVRKQAEFTQDSKVSISKFHDTYSTIKSTFTDTFFPFDFIQTHYKEYQCFLERNSDFLCEEGTRWKETEKGVIFYDVSKVKSTKELHHYRSTTIDEEMKYLNQCWDKCLLNQLIIPAQRIVVEKK